jgi:hypothetical protein
MDLQAAEERSAAKPQILNFEFKAFQGGVG